jgi:hypothetical protein
MTTSKYISDLFRLACEQMSVPYVKIEAEKLHAWSVDNNRDTFIALLTMSQNLTLSNQSDTVELDLGLAAAVETNGLYPEDNLFAEQVEHHQNECDELIGRFCEFVRRNEAINTMTYSIEESFNNSSYTGIGRVFSISINMNNVQDFCNDFGNKNTL